jgi:hypothetical protein
MTITITEEKKREEKNGKRKRKAMNNTNIRAPMVFWERDFRTAKSHKK